ncbi:Prespore-specific transcriptional regulator rsfA [Chlamydia abortus]|uniref:RsfA family transcriptional regulator n=1 Tax=Paenibacillus residui TaxID=629724 RepID=A0ABW3DBE0_9BACL|nr:MULTISPECIES: RsfA family transcriptional regulator [Paenibacillaceae]SHE10446.1 Prespore-specific transcriptional regulator rsfA [Chlamydia abortus]
MSAVRQDAWSEEDDLILAEVTLRHIRDGSTQLTAFEEVGEKIGRTAAACGFRWNSCVRKKYEAAIQIAKAQRQKRHQMKKQTGMPVSSVSSVAVLEGEAGLKGDLLSEETLSIDAVIRFLKQWKTSYQEMSRQTKSMERELQELQEEFELLKQENEKLSKQVNEVQSDYQVVNDDYRALIQIMDRARKMAFLVEEDDDKKSRFKMDANGNLERIE